MAAFCPKIRTGGPTRSFVMTGEVRLVGEGALNLPGAAEMAGMAGGGSIELWPVNGRKVGARAPGVCPGLGGYREVPPLPKVTRARREAEGRLLGGLAKARGLSGPRWLPGSAAIAKRDRSGAEGCLLRGWLMPEVYPGFVGCRKCRHGRR